jgi:quinolinate synthase
MAETAKILNPTSPCCCPTRRRLLARRPLPGRPVRDWLKQYPGHTVINYINSSAAVKALSDVIVTSSNAVDIVKQLPPDEPIVFGPDRHLGRWVEKQTGRKMVLWPGFCIVHEQFNARRLAKLTAAHPDAAVIAHPECEEAVLEKARFIGSTLALLKYVQNHPNSARSSLRPRSESCIRCKKRGPTPSSSARRRTLAATARCARTCA